MDPPPAAVAASVADTFATRFAELAKGRQAQALESIICEFFSVNRPEHLNVIACHGCAIIDVYDLGDEPGQSPPRYNPECEGCTRTYCDFCADPDSFSDPGEFTSVFVKCTHCGTRVCIHCLPGPDRDGLCPACTGTPQIDCTSETSKADLRCTAGLRADVRALAGPDPREFLKWFAESEYIAGVDDLAAVFCCASCRLLVIHDRADVRLRCENCGAMRCNSCTREALGINFAGDVWTVATCPECDPAKKAALASAAAPMS